MAAFGDDGAGSALMFVSTDGGQTWVTLGSNLTAQAVGALYGAASNGTAWVAVGGDGSQYAMASSTDGGVTWAGGPPGPGTLYAVAWDGAHWVAVGDDGSGNILIISNDSATAAAPNWSVLTTPASGAGSLRGIAHNGNSWLAVGGNGAQRIFTPSIDATLPSFAAPRTIAPGNYFGLAAHGSTWMAAGYDSSQSVPIIDRSPDGVTVTSSPQPQAAALTGIFGR
jgi:hypothetical protein